MTIFLKSYNINKRRYIHDGSIKRIRNEKIFNDDLMIDIIGSNKKERVNFWQNASLRYIFVETIRTQQVLGRRRGRYSRKRPRRTSTLSCKLPLAFRTPFAQRSFDCSHYRESFSGTLYNNNQQRHYYVERIKKISRVRRTKSAITFTSIYVSPFFNYERIKLPVEQRNDLINLCEVSSFCRRFKAEP